MTTQARSSLILAAAERKFVGTVFNINVRLRRGDYILLIKRSEAPLPEKPFLTVKAYTFNGEAWTEHVAFEHGHYDLTESEASKDFDQRVQA